MSHDGSKDAQLIRERLKVRAYGCPSGYGERRCPLGRSCCKGSGKLTSNRFLWNANHPLKDVVNQDTGVMPMDVS